MVDETPEAPAKKSDKKLFLVIAAIFIGMAIVYAVSLGPIEQPSIEVEGEEIEDIEQAYSADADQAEAPAEAAVAFDMAKALTERTLGDTSAPIKITEHSSFSCGHCGKFHKETFAAFKAAYIDTGKAYLVFSDFPLNAPALHASMTARCIPEDGYFEFTETLFKEQETWLSGSDYLEYLEAKAGEYGLDKAGFTACVQNEELQQALVSHIEAVQKQWSIQSTPSFVVNNQVVISGALLFADFDKAIQDAVAQIEAESAAEDVNEGE